MKRIARHAAACLLAAFSAMLAMLVLGLLRLTLLSGLPLAQALPDARNAAIVAVYAFVVSLLFVVVIGLPAYLLLHRRGRARARSLALVGAIAAALPMTWVFPLWTAAGRVHGSLGGLPSLSGWGYWLADVAMCALVGASAALACWWVVRVRANPH